METSELLNENQAFLIDQITNLTKQLSSKQLECIRLKSALKFYAEQNHWMPVSENAERSTVLCATGPHGINTNGWGLARAALDAVKD